MSNAYCGSSRRVERLVLLSTKITKTLNVPHLSITALDGLEISFHVSALCTDLICVVFTNNTSSRLRMLSQSLSWDQQTEKCVSKRK